MSDEISETIDVDGVPIAVRRQDGSAPGIMWLGGFRSDMTGTKAETLAGFARGKGLAFLRHDYSGHGVSGGAFRDGTISRWLAESLAVFRRFAARRADPGRLVDGRLDCAEDDRGIAQVGRQAAALWGWC